MFIGSAYNIEKKLSSGLGKGHIPEGQPIKRKFASFTFASEEVGL